MQNNPFIAWIVENWKRLTTKSPKFFKVWKIIMGIPALVVTLPNLIETLVKPFFPNLDLTFLDGKVNIAVTWAGAVGFWMSLLPVADVEKPQVKEKLPFTKTVSMILVLVSLSICGMAQNFFKPIEPRNKLVKPIRGIVAAPIVEPTFWAFRPSLIAATLFIGGTVEAAGGAGIAYQNITQKGADARNYVNYDIGVYMLAGGSVVRVDSVKTDIEKIALVATALNGTVGLGYAFSRQQSPGNIERKWKGGLCLVWKINLNN